MKEKSKTPIISLQDTLENFLHLQNGKEVEIGTLVNLFHGRGFPALLIILAFPFCLPVQIPGFSTPFGLLIAFLGLRIAFGKKLHFPQSILKKKISYATLKKIVKALSKAVDVSKKVIHPRLVFLVQSPILHRIHGITIMLLGLILALPLPIPLSNVLAAVSIIVLAVALLEDDGYALILGYILAIFTTGLLGFVLLLSQKAWTYFTGGS